MTNSQVPREPFQILFTKRLVHEAHIRVYADSGAIAGGNTSALLPSMLEGMETKEGNSCNICSLFEYMFLFYQITCCAVL